MNISFLGVIPVELNTTHGSEPFVDIQKKCPGSLSTLCLESWILKRRIRTEWPPIASFRVFALSSSSYLATFTYRGSKDLSVFISRVFVISHLSIRSIFYFKPREFSNPLINHANALERIFLKADFS